MNNLLLTGLILAVSACSFTTTSCFNPSKPSAGLSQSKLDSINTVVELGTSYGVTAALRSNPELGFALGLTADAIGLAVQAETYEPTAVKAAIADALKNQPQFAKSLAELGLALALDKYAEFYAANIQTYKDDHHVFASFLSAIGNGVRSAVSQYAAGTVKAPAPGANPLETLSKSDLTL